MGIDGQQLAQARNRAGLTQAALGRLLGVTGRTIRDWERTRVPPHKEARVLDIDRLWKEPGPSPLADYSDMALLMELGRRLDEYREALESRSGNADEKAVDQSPASGTNAPGPEDFPQVGWGRGPRLS